jgi:hypothetical protein
MINQRKTPKDKVLVLINFCNILSNMVMNSGREKKHAGADEVFPLVVYAILKANVRKLKSNLVFIQYFRHQTRLESQEEYCFTAINTAIEFIEKLSKNHLSIEEFEYSNFLNHAENEELNRLKKKIPERSK